jgi:hypothetical protein
MNTLDYLINRAHELGIKVDYPGETTKEIKCVVFGCDVLTVRAAPSAKAYTVHYLMRGDPVTVWDTIGDWALIGENRWVNSNYLKDA